MAEAIKTLQRALEDPRLSIPSSARRSPSASSLSSDTHFVDPFNEEADGDEESIHREFIEEEIGALRRLSGDGERPLPPVRASYMC